MRNPVIVVGGGGHAKVLLDILLSQFIEVIGITDSNPQLIGKQIWGIPVLGSDEMILQYPPDRVQLVNGLGTTSVSNIRKSVYGYFKKMGYSFSRIIHPSAIISSRSELAEGVQVMAGTVIQSGTVIGENTIVNTKASIDHDGMIGSHVHIAPGVVLSGGVQIGDGAHIGTGAVIIQGISIGENSLVAAGATVIKNVPKQARVMGTPAKEVRYE